MRQGSRFLDPDIKLGSIKCSLGLPTSKPSELSSILPLQSPPPLPLTRLHGVGIASDLKTLAPGARPRIDVAAAVAAQLSFRLGLKCFCPCTRQLRGEQALRLLILGQQPGCLGGMGRHHRATYSLFASGTALEIGVFLP